MATPPPPVPSPAQIPAPLPPPAPGLGAVVVIPCHDEPEALATHESLRAALPPQTPVEILWVINGSARDGADVRARNLATLRALADAPADAARPTLIVHRPDLPPRHAGVGLARRIGMDLAAARLEAAGNPRGPILCLDGDCTVSPGYLRACLAHFDAHPRAPGASIHYEHPLEGPLDPAIYGGICRYELHLRTYVHGLAWAGLPFAHQTVGSSMAVRGDVYRAQGGMNKRKAGEDFYFLHKIITLGGFTDLRDATVYPSPRISHRVPFGTGRAMGRWLEGDAAPGLSYAPETYDDLRDLTRAAPTLRSLRGPALRGMLSGLSPCLRGFLEDQGFPDKLKAVQDNTRTDAAFRARFYRVFDGFTVMKYANHARETAYPPVPVEVAAAAMLRRRGLHRGPPGQGPRALLMRYRGWDRGDGTSQR